MKDLVKIENSNGLARDMATRAVINTNVGEYKKYLARREAEQSARDQLDLNTQRINKLESDISDIKQMLISLINKDK